MPSTGVINRSVDSLSSTVRSTSSAIEKMIPSWIKNPSPVSSRQQPEEEESKSRAGSSRLSYFGQSMEEEEEESVVEDPPKPSIQQLESSRSATNVLEEAEPIWLRDLRVRRSLKNGRRKPPVVKSPPPMDARLAGGQTQSDRIQFSRPRSDRTNFQSTVSDQTAQLHAHLHLHQYEHIQEDPARNSRENLLVASAADPKAEEPKAPPLVASREKLPKAEPVVFRLPAKKPASSIPSLSTRSERVCTVRMRLLPSVSTLEAN